MGETKRNIVGFKKFSDLKKPKVEEVELGLTSQDGQEIPANPNLPNNSKKEEKTSSLKNIIPEDKKVESDKIDESNVKTYGKVAKFPKNVKASKAYNFLENVKVPKKSIWYIMVEKQDSELQMVKYNYKEGVDLYKFVNELKKYYSKKNKGDQQLSEAISKLKVEGNDKYSIISNISKIELEGKPLITLITEDLIRLLSK